MRGKALEWTLTVIAAGLSLALFDSRGAPSAPGDHVTVTFELRKGDRQTHSCAWAGTTDGYRCAYEKADQKWSDPIANDLLLTPHSATNGLVYLLPNLFSPRILQDATGARGLPWKRPVHATCQLELIQRIKRVQAKWRLRDGWHGIKYGWVAKVISCRAGD